ncbi:MAG: lysine transporter LysE [Burkholderiales bacterium PBB2]|nr:MAG: lysine transporter LysE [Burkholderiales bacterium PBB2]
MSSTLFTIALLHWVVLITPGANFVLVGQLAASGQRGAACAAAFGITTVTLSWASLAILGIGVVFSAHPALRQLAQIAGGLYLLYLASKLWRAGAGGDAGAGGPMSRSAAFRLGFLTNVLNPKTALFFGSVFATVLPADPSWAVSAAAVGLVYANALVWHLFLALAFSLRPVQGFYERQRRLLNRVSAALVGGFGTRLLFSTWQELRVRWA